MVFHPRAWHCDPEAARSLLRLPAPDARHDQPGARHGPLRYRQRVRDLARHAAPLRKLSTNGGHAMTRKKKEPKASAPSALKVQGDAMTKRTKPVEDESKHHARCALLSEVNASSVIEVFGKGLYGDTSGQEAYELLQELTHKASSAKASERMLLSQAHALDVVFANLARRAASHIGCNMLTAMETYMRLALRAQNQARMTLETLATIKNPPMVFAKQANIANNQQVNNGEAVPVARAGEKQKAQTELLEAPHGKPEWMDAGATTAARCDDSPLATVEAIDRAAHGSRKGNGKP
jgi:hypothetical protein